MRAHRVREAGGDSGWRGRWEVIELPVALLTTGRSTAAEHAALFVDHRLGRAAWRAASDVTGLGRRPTAILDAFQGRLAELALRQVLLAYGGNAEGQPAPAPVTDFADVRRSFDDARGEFDLALNGRKLSVKSERRVVGRAGRVEALIGPMLDEPARIDRPLARFRQWTWHAHVLFAFDDPCPTIDEFYQRIDQFGVRCVLVGGFDTDFAERQVLGREDVPFEDLRTSDGVDGWKLLTLLTEATGAYR